jgi:hypothetical protein
MSNRHAFTHPAYGSPLPRLAPIAERAAEQAYVQAKPRPKCSRKDFKAGFTAALVWANVAYAFNGDAAAA